MYKPQGRNKVTLVFDGYPALDFRSNRYPNIDVIFGRDKSADEIIKHILKDELVSKNLVVVSDDKEIVDKARFYNAKTISSKVFFDKVKNKFRQRNKNDLDDKIISYTEMHKINKELKEIWLRDSNKDEE